MRDGGTRAQRSPANRRYTTLRNDESTALEVYLEVLHVSSILPKVRSDRLLGVFGMSFLLGVFPPKAGGGGVSGAGG